jgi:hypothetical protein
MKQLIYKIIVKLLKVSHLEYLISDEAYLKILFRRIMNQQLDLKNPKTFNAKLQYLKLHDRKPLYTKLVDKFEVKKYVADLIGEEYIIPTLGVWEKFDDIDFAKLPEKFVLKCTHDSGSTAICDKNDLMTINKAKKKIRADVVIVAVGGSSARDFKTNYKETGAAIADSHTISDMECGEGFDRASLQLLGLQNRLLEALKTTGKPMVVVYIEGRPLDMNWSADNADALLTAYYPGQEGGNAIADVLFGDYNPAGRLPVTVPRNVGQLPVYYNHRRPSTHDYVEMSAQPLYPFGFGLSYSRFEYSNLKVEKNQDNTYSVSFDVLNSGERDGEEVPQLYLSTELPPRCSLCFS